MAGREEADVGARITSARYRVNGHVARAV
jgi:hypothetical protein